MKLVFRHLTSFYYTSSSVRLFSSYEISCLSSVFGISYIRYLMRSTRMTILGRRLNQTTSPGKPILPLPKAFFERIFSSYYPDTTSYTWTTDSSYPDSSPTSTYYYLPASSPTGPPLTSTDPSTAVSWTTPTTESLTVRQCITPHDPHATANHLLLPHHFSIHSTPPAFLDLIGSVAQHRLRLPTTELQC